MTDRAVSVASLNIRGWRLDGSRLPERYRSIAAAFSASTVDVVNLQEVVSYYHLSLLSRHMSSFRYRSYRPSPVGPSGGVVTLSRIPVAGAEFHPFRLAAAGPGLSRLTRVRARLKGTLVTRLPDPQLCVVNTHPLANVDGDWSVSNRFYRAQREQLARLAGIVRDLPVPVVVCGDFNVTRDSELHREFLGSTGLVDAFSGGCPPTFHAEYLGPDQAPHTIDFILVSEPVAVREAEVLFGEKVVMSRGAAHLSDHLGLRAVLGVPG